MSSPNVLAAIAVVCLVIALVKRLSSRSKEVPYPPGPKPLPFLGNIRDIPLVSPWITYTEWRRTYGHGMPGIRFLFTYFHYYFR